MLIAIPEPVAQRIRRGIRVSMLGELRRRREAGETLRDLAAWFDCSHETIRIVLQRIETT